MIQQSPSSIHNVPLIWPSRWWTISHFCSLSWSWPCLMCCCGSDTRRNRAKASCRSVYLDAAKARQNWRNSTCYLLTECNVRLCLQHITCLIYVKATECVQLVFYAASIQFQSPPAMSLRPPVLRFRLVWLKMRHQLQLPQFWSPNAIFITLCDFHAFQCCLYPVYAVCFFSHLVTDMLFSGFCYSVTLTNDNSIVTIFLHCIYCQLCCMAVVSLLYKRRQ